MFNKEKLYHLRGWKSIFIVFILLYTTLSSNVFAENIEIQWTDLPGELDFKNASFSSKYEYLPFLSIQKNGSYQVDYFQVLQSKKVSNLLFTKEQLEIISDEWQFSTEYGSQKRAIISTTEIFPFRKSGNEIEIIESFQFEMGISNNNAKSSSLLSQQYASNSFLASGDWYKFGVEKNGVYKLDAAFLEKFGWNLQDVNASNIKIFGHKGGMLPLLSGAERTDDIREIPIKVIGQGKNIEIHAYLEGPESWKYNPSTTTFQQTKNLYTDLKTYFIRVGNSPGLRVNTANEISETANKTIQVFDDYQHIEEDLLNLLESGNMWLGPEIGANNQLQYNFTFPNIVKSTPAKITIGLAAKSTSNTNTFQVSSSGAVLRNISIAAVGSSYLSNAANYSETSTSLNNPESTFPIIINYNRPDYNAKAWSDFITVNAQRSLVFGSEPLYFRSIASIGNGAVSQFQISNWNNNATIWDVTDLFNIKEIKTNSGTFKSQTELLKEFAAFQTPNLIPTPIGKIQNQNLHALDQADYLIVTRKPLISYAREIGDFHLQEEGLSYHVVDIEDVFNEFSSGNNDLSAVRNFVKMFYDRAASQPETAPKYLLLFGNGNFDNRALGDFLLPSYQSTKSFQTVETYVTDDFFGLLDDSEGDDVINTSTNITDIAIGRITVDNLEKARHAVDKIKRYYAQSAYGSWRSQIAFMADDEDNNIHIRDANEVADIILNDYLNYNMNKIYLDAFKQQSVSGGNRYPDINEMLNNKIFQGLFFLNFVGHGGPNGLTDEKVVTFDEINRWSNKDKLFLFCTATCEFTRFDLPKRNSAGERILVKPDGGAIALVSTTRLVFSDKNRIINENFTKYLMKASNEENQTIGNIFLRTKNNTNTRENNRKFALFGDPALRLAYPKNEVVTTDILAYSEATDTIKSLAKVTIQGEVRENGEKSSGFNGIVNVSVYDKMTSQSTLSNDPTSPTYNFKVRNSNLYSGRTKANNGAFEITFVVPKDINYTYGQGKLSYYADNGTWDAMGYDQDFTIGGVADSVPLDNQGPKVDVYIDDQDFVFGGIASRNSTLYIQLEDENGINTSGTGIGHDITAILNEDSKNPIILNSFYEGEIGDYKKGQVKYPFNQLENGRYKVNVKAWDVLNNSGDGYTEFVVEDKAELALYYVLNYPNPFTTKTEFSFEHNRPGDLLDVRIEIYTVSGKIIKTLQTSSLSNSRRVHDIEWNGLDDYGDKIGKGVYIYKVSVKDSSGEKAYKYQKLVLLR
ncbi:MAG TPA: type IX secretion system sortase PorU [Chitinophagales bacterium]|nr:type IX secretion system sortase PorU [Chitinophagales bacterium]